MSTIPQAFPHDFSASPRFGISGSWSRMDCSRLTMCTSPNVMFRHSQLILSQVRYLGGTLEFWCTKRPNLPNPSVSHHLRKDYSQQGEVATPCFAFVYLWTPKMKAWLPCTRSGQRLSRGDSEIVCCPSFQTFWPSMTGGIKPVTNQVRWLNVIKYVPQDEEAKYWLW